MGSLQSGVVGAMPGSGNSINQQLINTNPTTGTVTYIVTPTYQDCISEPIQVVVQVLSEPLIEFKLYATDLNQFALYNISSGTTFTLDWETVISHKWNTRK